MPMTMNSSLIDTFNTLLNPKAQFVDAIHTDARHLIPDIGFGMYETSGHLDFYPNGGISWYPSILFTSFIPNQMSLKAEISRDVILSAGHQS